MAVRISLPPTPLGSGLASTLLLYSLSLLRNVEAVVSRGGFGELVVDVDTEPKTLESKIVAGLRDLEARVKAVKLPLPLVVAAGPGTDRSALSSMAKSCGLSMPAKLRAEARPALYHMLLNLLEHKRGRVVDELACVKVRVSPKRTYEICLGECKDTVPVPTAVKSDAFYEIGRFGGASDRRRGRPDVGRVDYRGCPSYVALLYMGLLALHAGYDDGDNLLLTLQLQPGSRIKSLRAGDAVKLYDDTFSMVSSVGMRVWKQSVEGLRLAVLYWLIPLASNMPEAVTLQIHVLGLTGRRFYTKWFTSISRRELELGCLALKSFVEETGAGSVERLSRLMTVLISSVLEMASRREALGESVSKLWSGVRSLAYSLLEARRHVVLDDVYQLLRLLSDKSAGLYTELMGSISRTAERFKLDLSQLLLEKDETTAAGIWRTLRRLAMIVAG